MRLLLFLTTTATITSSFALAASSEKDEPPLEPCTIRAPSGSFFDLSPLHITVPESGKKGAKDSENPVESWHSRGYDYDANFTMNFCGPVVEDLEDVVGVKRNLWSQVNAFYEKNDRIYSIGQQTGNFTFRGRTLSMTFTDGSPCGESASLFDESYNFASERYKLAHPESSVITDDLSSTSASSTSSDDDEDVDTSSSSSTTTKTAAKKPRPSSSTSSSASNSPTSSSPSTERRKSTIISFLCDRDPPPKSPKVVLNFVSVTPDECTYVFNARSPAACPAVNTQKQSLGPSGVFSVIAVIAILVYVLGGIVYQRSVMHQRGWRQLPNYSLWAGIFTFLRDFVIIIASSILRICPCLNCAGFSAGRKGYSRLGSGGGGLNGRGLGRGRADSADQENRLIDQLDEEWED